jgi:hypothetical protein
LLFLKVFWIFKPIEMSKFKITLLPIFLLTIFLTNCGPKSTEEQFELIMKSKDPLERQNISYVLANSLDTNAVKLFFGVIHNPLAIESLENMLARYSEIISTEPKQSEKALQCVQLITAPNSQDHDSLKDKKIDLLIHGLNQDFSSMEFENALILSVKKYGNEAMIKLIEAWYQNRYSAPLLHAIQSFENDAVEFLISKMETDTVAIDLLARFGQPIVNTMIEKMKDKEQSVRFAAGDVLVQMIKYDPKAVDALTSAIDMGGVGIIAKNYPFYIRLGQYGTEKILLKALEAYFNQVMCVDYLNCGNSELESGATEIAYKNGFYVERSFGSHYGPIWGSGN